MPVINGDVFVVSPPYTENNSIIFGKNSFEGNVQEVKYYEAKTEDSGQQKCSTIEVETSPSLPIIISRSSDISFGCESGANSKSVTIGLIWVDNENEDDKVLQSTDLVRLGLERGNTAEEALEVITTLNEKYGSGIEAMKAPKFSFLICDTQSAWLLNIVGQLWAAEKLEGFRSISLSLGITTKVDKSSKDLKENIKRLGYWDDEEEFNFSLIFAPNQKNNAIWSDGELSEGSFNITNMFELLRKEREHHKIAQTSQVSVLTATGISNHWFTATSNPRESVFKPFVFTAHAKISPLTNIHDNDNVTLLHKLHSQRSWENIGELLQSLEETCVREIQGYLLEKAGPGNPELDELMKDCVEAEVKFYR